MAQGSVTNGPGPLVVVSGPSGVGKTTLVDELLKRGSLAIRRAVTATTRQPRPGEVDDKSYHFWTIERFQKSIDAGLLLEWERVFGQDYYGTPRDEVDPHRADGEGVVLVIDVNGAARVRQLCPDAVSIFIRPPDFAALEARLRGRGDMNENRIQRRLATAREEMARESEFHVVITNDTVEQSVRELERSIRKLFPTEE